VLYLAHELRDAGVAVNVLLPGHTRSTGSDEQEAERALIRERLGQPAVTPRRLRPEHVVPLALHLAEQGPSSGLTGQVLRAMEWNQQHQTPAELEQWVYPADARS